MMLIFTLLFTLVAPAQEAPDTPDTAAEPTAAEGSRRLVFDDRLVRGEAAGGAVAITQRPPRALPALVAERVSFLAWTVQPVLGRAPEAATGTAPTQPAPPSPAAKPDPR